MADALSTLAWKLGQATGLQVYPAPKPANVALPCLTYQVISDPMQDHNHSAGASIHHTRVQINHIGKYETTRPYVNTVQSALEGNKTDFLSCISAGAYRETFEGNETWTLSKDYFIQWK